MSQLNNFKFDDFVSNKIIKIDLMVAYRNHLNLRKRFPSRIGLFWYVILVRNIYHGSNKRTVMFGNQSCPT